MRFACVAALAALLLHCATGSAQEPSLLFARGGLGAGYGLIDYRVGSDDPRSEGPALLWDAALGAFVTRWLALHASAFGSVSPDARPTTSCSDDCGPDRRETLWAQTYGAGLTFSRPRGIRNSRVRFFSSTSCGLAIARARILRATVGVGVQVLLGFEYDVRDDLRVGLALQGMFEGRRPAQVLEDHYSGWHGGGLVTVAFDRRRARR